MGVVASRTDESAPLYLKDQNRLVVSQVRITNAKNRVLYIITPNAFPATRYVVKRSADEDGLVEYVQDPDNSSSTNPNLLLRLNQDDDIIFHFTFAMRQTTPSHVDHASPATPGVDTIIKGLTFLFASSTRDMDNLVTREFNADPNLHKNPNVDLVGDFSTGGSPLEPFEWSWKWQPPRTERDRGGGWRNTCSFVEYDQRAHRLNTLVNFSFWVQGSQRPLGSPKTPPARLELSAPPRVRMTSSYSLESRLSDSENELKDVRDPPSPGIPAIPEDEISLEPAASNTTVKVDLNTQRPEEDISVVEDGPVFRATIKALEQKTGNMRAKMKKVIKKAEAAKEAQVICNASVAAFMEALREASTSNANAIQPALDHYFESTATAILAYEKQNADNLQRLIIDPISKLYSNDIKQVESKKKDFEDESRDYYAYVGRYLGQRQDSLKEKKRVESDTKYQTKRRNFELKRFDYSSFMQDLHGGRKDQEVLSYLTKYADTQAKGFLATAKKVDGLIPQLDALSYEVKEADKEYQLLRTGREEKRRTLEKGNKVFIEPEAGALPGGPLPVSAGGSNGARMTPTDAEATFSGPFARSTSTERPKTGINPGPDSGFGSSVGETAASGVARSASTTNTSSPGQNKFKGIRDLEESDHSAANLSSPNGVQHRKEGLLWSLSRPGSHADPKGLNKQAWHKFWIVLDQGKLSEYVNWKQGLESHIDPIDLRMASVREARNAERRFCFEVITPNFTRVYQAPSEEDMKSWIFSINNALQSAFEERGAVPEPQSSVKTSGSIGRELFGKSSSYHGHRSTSTSNAYLASKSATRHTTAGDRPVPVNRSRSTEERPARLLQSIKDADAGNAWCAECGSESRVEWVAINLGIIVCIECSGIHRSLGTHVSKIRSLILDTNSFTQDLVELLLQIGNRVSNMIWEATYSAESRIQKPTPAAIRDVRIRFITAKYMDKAFIRQSANLASAESPTASRLLTADESLLLSIKKSDLQGVLNSLFSLRASPNAKDHSRATPALYLALAAVDPAAPGSTPSRDPSPSPSSTSQERKSFPIAELLLQNGADIPTTPPPFPLGKSAKAYLDMKREQRSGKTQPESSSATADNGLGGDILTALPTASSAGTNSSTGSKDGSSERSKIVKRISSSSRSAFGSNPPGIT